MAANGAGHQVGIEFLQVQTMCDSRAEAMALARAAVEARLAAGSQVAGPMASTFWWNDEVERSEEWFVFFKTTADRCKELIEFISERHTYDEPEIVATEFVAGSPSFLAWIAEETRPWDSGGARPGVPRPREAAAGAQTTSDVPS